MHDVWERIEAVLRADAPHLLAALRGGASPESIAAAERALGFALPDDLRTSYGVHDGGGEAGVLPQDTYGNGWAVAAEFLSLDEVIRTRQLWLDGLDGGVFESSRAAPTGPIRKEWWNRRWVPVTWDGGGDHLCVDLDPAAGGVVGQVISFSHEVGPLYVVANGWRAFLEAYASDLEAGRLLLPEDEQVYMWRPGGAA